jgi:hypothetical protein
VTKPQKSFIALTPRREGVGPLERLVVVVVVAVGNEEAGEQSTQVRIRQKGREDLGQCYKTFFQRNYATSSVFLYDFD